MDALCGHDAQDAADASRLAAEKHVIATGVSRNTTRPRFVDGRDTAAGSLRTPRSCRILRFGRSRLPQHVPETYRQPDELLELGEEQTCASCQLLNNKRVGEPSGEGAVFFRWKRIAGPVAAHHTVAGVDVSDSGTRWKPILHDNNT